MASRSNSPYDPFAFPVARKRWTPLKILMLMLALVVLLVLAVVAWSLLAPMLFHTTPTPLPFSNPVQHQIKHW